MERSKERSKLNENSIAPQEKAKNITYYTYDHENRHFGAAAVLNVVIRATKIQMARREFQNELDGKRRKGRERRGDGRAAAVVPSS